jgi:thioredoxin-dependent peroxiredoxin
VTRRFFCALVVAVLASCSKNGQPLAPGSAAPDFELAGSDGKSHHLAELRGHTVVLAWFPKAFTGG